MQINFSDAYVIKLWPLSLSNIVEIRILLIHSMYSFRRGRRLSGGRSWRRRKSRDEVADFIFDANLAALVFWHKIQTCQMDHQ